MSKRWIWGTACVAGVLAISADAGASSDFGCAARWTLADSAYQCGGSGMISPRNDTRINLAWLLRDRAGVSAPGALTYPRVDWYGADFGHLFLSWEMMQAALWPAPGGDDADAMVEEGEHAGSRCQSLSSGNDAFAAALAASRELKPDERALLVQARALVAPACHGETGRAAWPQGVSSPAGLSFLAYLDGARAFYAGDFATARARFAAPGKGADPWVAETARYMVARNELAAAQDGAFDEWGTYLPEKADRSAAQRGQAALADYLSAYPQGRYAVSAEGLRRRAQWLAGDGRGLALTYSRMLAAQPAADATAPLLLQEVEAKLLFGTGTGSGSGIATDAQAPLLLATWDLVRMRQTDPELAEFVPKPLSAQELAAQAPVFARDPDLFGFLQASHAFHVAHDWQRVLALIPDDARRTGYTPLAFSRQLLRGLALERLGDRNADGFWQQLANGAHDLYQRPAVELALAMNWERGGTPGRVFAPDSPVREPEIRARLLDQVAGPDLLRAQARAGTSGLERDVAVFTLLYKQLSRGRYDAFGRDLALVPGNAGVQGWIGGWWSDPEHAVPVGLFRVGRWQQDGFACPALARTAATLSADPSDVRGRLCLGEFYRLNGFDAHLADEGRPAPDELGGTPGAFPGKALTRAGIYAAVLADRRATPDEAAYALYRSVMCYAPGGNNSCGGDDVPLAQRRAWYQRLKRDHPKSRWATSLRFFW